MAHRQIAGGMLLTSAGGTLLTTIDSNTEVVNIGLDSVESNGESTASICSEKGYWPHTKLNSLRVKKTHKSVS